MPARDGAVHVATTKRVYKGRVYQTHLLRRTFRDGNNVKHQTLGNISHLPPDLIDTIRARLQGAPPSHGGHFEIIRSLPHGHVAAVLGTLRQIGLEDMLASRACPQRVASVAMIVARVINARSKLATSRALVSETAASSLGLELGIETLCEDDLYAAMDWLEARQERIENKLAKKHLGDSSLILYDVSSSFYTGTHCSLAKFGYNRDGKNGCPQIVYGLLCNAEGCPIAVEVFEGNTGDSTTLTHQVEKVRKRFGLNRVVIVGDRGMITNKRIEQDFRGVEGLDWISALRADAIKKLAEQKVIQPTFFDDRDLVEISSPDFPGERLVVCRNPFLADERTRKREDLLSATEKKLAEIVEATKRPKRRLKGQDKIGLRVGKVINKYKVAKHFIIEITDDGFSFQRDGKKIVEEAALDGIYVIRTSVPTETLSAESTVRAYKDLAKVERAFRCLKTVDLKVRPIYHWTENRVRAHVLLCMLAYYVEWHMRKKLAPLLFEDDDKKATESSRQSIVRPAERSERAKVKDITKKTANGQPVHSFRSLLDDMATLCKNRVRAAGIAESEFYLLTRPTQLQAQLFELLGIAVPA